MLMFIYTFITTSHIFWLFLMTTDKSDQRLDFVGKENKEINHYFTRKTLLGVMGQYEPKILTHYVK